MLGFQIKCPQAVRCYSMLTKSDVEGVCVGVLENKKATLQFYDIDPLLSSAPLWLPLLAQICLIELEWTVNSVIFSKMCK